MNVKILQEMNRKWTSHRKINWKEMPFAKKVNYVRPISPNPSNI